MKVYELLADPARWTKGEYARNENGDPVIAHDRNACSWCIAGAANRCYPLNTATVRDKLWQAIGNPAAWNDAPERTHEDVINLCRELDI